MIVIVLVLLKDHGFAQLGMNLLLTIVEVIILAVKKPFLRRLERDVSLLNESILLCVYILYGVVMAC